MANYSISTIDKILKLVYHDLETAAYEKSRLLAKLSKDKTGGGKSDELTLKHTNTGGQSSSYTVARANAGVPGLVRFSVPMREDYSIQMIEGAALRGTKGDEHALVEVVDLAVETGLNESILSVGANLFSNGGGARGQLVASSSGVGTSTIQLKSDSNMRGLDIGIYVQAAITDGTSGAVASGRALITNIDRVNKTLTTSGNWNAGGNIPDITDGYFVFREGDFGDGCLVGLPGWVPQTEPVAGVDSFFGVDRGVDPTRLAGLRYAPGSGTRKEVLLDASAIGFEQGVAFDLLVMNPLDKSSVFKDIDTNIVQAVTSKPKVGYQTFAFDGQGGPVEVCTDGNCPRGQAWLLTQEDWELVSMGDVPGILEHDGMKVRHGLTFDGVELHVGGYMKLLCHNPANQMHVTFPTQ